MNDRTKDRSFLNVAFSHFFFGPLIGSIRSMLPKIDAAPKPIPRAFTWAKACPVKKHVLEGFAVAAVVGNNLSLISVNVHWRVCEVRDRGVDEDRQKRCRQRRWEKGETRGWRKRDEEKGYWLYVRSYWGRGEANDEPKRTKRKCER